MGLKQNQMLLERYPVLAYFQYNHLDEGPLRRTSVVFNTVAWKMAKTLPENGETRKALDRLLEAKDAAVRSALSLPVEILES